MGTESQPKGASAEDPPIDGGKKAVMESAEESGGTVEVERLELSELELQKMGYHTVEAFLRAELAESQGASGGYNTGVNAKRSLNIGLTESGRNAFREARKKAVSDYLAGNLVGALSKVD